ncbi:polyhydroxyalkanoic acid system family protein [Methylocella sp.]|uniref:polyhydroxyalkanoic acid system family protein n=1 Tax=Methylocella sp. TaxID=1978226 RepID=UPI003783DF27
MSKSIVITVPHQLGAADAKKRVCDRIEMLRSAYVDKVAHTEVKWVGDKADVRVVAFGQTVTAQIDVMPDQLRIEAQLPWLLGTIAHKVQGALTQNARESLQIGFTPPKK